MTHTLSIVISEALYRHPVQRANQTVRQPETLAAEWLAAAAERTAQDDLRWRSSSARLIRVLATGPAITISTWVADCHMTISLRVQTVKTDREGHVRRCR